MSALPPPDTPAGCSPPRGCGRSRTGSAPCCWAPAWRIGTCRPGRSGWSSAPRWRARRLMSVLVARYADRVGRRRCMPGCTCCSALVGVVFAVRRARCGCWRSAALTGVLSTEVIESGPFTSLEQPMLASDLRGRAQVHGFGDLQRRRRGGRFVRCAVAAAARPDQRRWTRRPAVVPGAGTRRGGRRGRSARSLTPAVEPVGVDAGRGRLVRSRSTVSAAGRRCSPSTRSGAGSPCRRSSPTG